MDADKVEQILILNSSKFPPESFSLLKQRLCECDDAKVLMIFASLKDPMLALVLSVCLGYFGVDRFYIGSVGIGIGKLITCGGAYIWWIIDCFLIMDAARQKNLEIALQLL